MAVCRQVTGALTQQAEAHLPGTCPSHATEQPQVLFTWLLMVRIMCWKRPGGVLCSTRRVSASALAALIILPCSMAWVGEASEEMHANRHEQPTPPRPNCMPHAFQMPALLIAHSPACRVKCCRRWPPPPNPAPAPLPWAATAAALAGPPRGWPAGGHDET